MPKKSFLEEELARESRTRQKSKGWFARLLHKVRKDTDTQHIDRAKAIIAAKEADRYGLILTPNETRAIYSYPTISDEPQSVIKDPITKLTAENHRLTSELMYRIAIDAMRGYGKVAE